MKFSDIQFKPHPSGIGGRQGLVFFPNGYGASIVGGAPGLYGNGITTFEVAVIHGSKEGFSLVYDTHITDDVLGYQSKDEVSEVLNLIEQLPPRN